MGEYVELLKSLPETPRDVAARTAARDEDAVRVAKHYGREYFDGDRRYGYGGYRYDGRWRPVAAEIMRHYRLHHGQRVLDVGCAKGFLVKDLCDAGLDAYGLDASPYAIVQCPHPDVVGRLHREFCWHLPFPDGSFDLVISINTLHNCARPGVVRSLQEMRRVSRGRMFVQVDSYRTPEERARFEAWVLTAETHGDPDFWLALFAEAGYDGDYAWTILEA